MTTPETPILQFSDEQHRAQAEEFMLELGRFAIEFERVCEAMSFTVIAIFHSEGLQHQGLSQVVVGDKASAQLQQLVGALFAELRNRYTDEDRAAVRVLLKEVKELTEQRNDVIHTAWQFGNAARDFELMAVAIRRTASQNKGSVPQHHGLTPSHLRKLSTDARRLQVLFSRLHKCLLQNGFSPAKEFAAPL